MLHVFPPSPVVSCNASRATHTHTFLPSPPQGTQAMADPGVGSAVSSPFSAVPGPPPHKDFAFRSFADAAAAAGMTPTSALSPATAVAESSGDDEGDAFFPREDCSADTCAAAAAVAATAGSPAGAAGEAPLEARVQRLERVTAQRVDSVERAVRWVVGEVGVLRDAVRSLEDDAAAVLQHLKREVETHAHRLAAVESSAAAAAARTPATAAAVAAAAAAEAAEDERVWGGELGRLLSETDVLRREMREKEAALSASVATMRTTHGAELDRLGMLVDSLVAGGGGGQPLLHGSGGAASGARVGDEGSPAGSPMKDAWSLHGSSPATVRHQQLGTPQVRGGRSIKIGAPSTHTHTNTHTAARRVARLGGPSRTRIARATSCEQERRRGTRASGAAVRQRPQLRHTRDHTRGGGDEAVRRQPPRHPALRAERCGQRARRRQRTRRASDGANGGATALKRTSLKHPFSPVQPPIPLPPHHDPPPP